MVPEILSEKSPGNEKSSSRQVNVYDAVAGRINYDGFLARAPYISKTRDTLSSSTVSIPPEEVLFRRKRAPPRYEENDFYWADKNLKHNQSLPDPDLLKEIHVYASDFYSRATLHKGQGDFKSMDETALLAMGILLEEAAKEILGDAGDLVFVEGENDNSTEKREVDRLDSKASGTMNKSRASAKSRTRKRRKLNGATDEAP